MSQSSKIFKPTQQRLQEVMEFCISPRSVKEIAEFQGVTKCYVTLLTSRLRQLGYMRMDRNGIRLPTGWSATFVTIKIGEIPEPEPRIRIIDYTPDVTDPVIAQMFGYTNFVCPQAEKENTHIMEDFSHRKNELRPQEFRGIVSTFSIMDAA